MVQLFAFDVDRDCPDETEQFSPYCRYRDRLFFARVHQVFVAATEPLLRLPGDVDYLLAEPFLPLLELPTDPGPV